MLHNNMFFNTIFKNEQVNFRCLRENTYPVTFNGYHNDNMANILNNLNEQGYEIYYVVNTGGYRDQDINKINAVFIDLDCGRNEEGNYYDQEQVNEYKREKLQKLNTFIFKPSFVVDTRNGLHVLWLLKDNVTIQEFNKCQERLINYFEADRQARNVARLLRVPNYYWNKDKNNKYLCKLVEQNDVKYDVKDIIDSLIEYDDKSKISNSTNNKKNNNILLSIVGKKSYP